MKEYEVRRRDQLEKVKAIDLPMLRRDKYLDTLNRLDQHLKEVRSML